MLFDVHCHIKINYIDAFHLRDIALDCELHVVLPHYQLQQITIKHFFK